MLAMLSAALPVFASVTTWAALEAPTVTLEKLRLVGVRATNGPTALPLKLITCGAPAASSWIETAPLRDQGAVGLKVTESVQVLALDTLFPQLSVSAKSPVVVMDEIASGELPMLRSRTVCGELLVPTAWLEYCSM